MNKYKFYIPEGILVPTDLRLKKDNVTIVYRRDKEDSLTWHFDLYNVSNMEEAESIIHELISMMSDQSFDHGAEWRLVSCDLVVSSSIYVSYLVKFRIKDTW